MIGEIFDYIGKKVKILTIDKSIYEGFIFSYTPGYEIGENEKDSLGIGPLDSDWGYSVDLDDIESIEVIED